MKIKSVTVRYGALRSTGYPNFSNKTVAVELSADLEPGETANSAKETLFRHAKHAVCREFGEKVGDDNQMDIPF
jgi:hypothetical protein